MSRMAYSREISQSGFLPETQQRARNRSLMQPLNSLKLLHITSGPGSADCPAARPPFLAADTE
jgi:hypothetical protein